MSSYSINEIMKMLPHRSPFLLIDRVIECEAGKRAVAIKNVTIDEPFFNGHFSTEPILPGVLIVETIAQTTVVMYCASFMESIEVRNDHAPLTPEKWEAMIKEHVGYLVEIKTMKFMKKVTPGDTMRIEVIVKNKFANLSLIESKVKVDGVIVAMGKIAVSEKV